MPWGPVLAMILVRGGAGGIVGFVVGFIIASNIGVTTTNSLLLVLLVCTIVGIALQSGWKALQTANQPTQTPPAYKFPSQVGSAKTQVDSTASTVPGQEETTPRSK